MVNQQELVANSLDGEPRVKALLSLDHVFGELSVHPKFVEAIINAYLSLKNNGAKQIVTALSQIF